MADPIEAWVRNRACTHRFTLRSVDGVIGTNFRCDKCRLIASGSMVIAYAMAAETHGSSVAEVAPKLTLPIPKPWDGRGR